MKRNYFLIGYFPSTSLSKERRISTGGWGYRRNDCQGQIFLAYTYQQPDQTKTTYRTHVMKLKRFCWPHWWLASCTSGSSCPQCLAAYLLILNQPVRSPTSCCIQGLIKYNHNCTTSCKETLLNIQFDKELCPETENLQITQTWTCLQ